MINNFQLFEIKSHISIYFKKIKKININLKKINGKDSTSITQNMYFIFCDNFKNLKRLAVILSNNFKQFITSFDNLKAFSNMRQVEFDF